VKHANAASGVDEEAMKLYGGPSGEVYALYSTGVRSLMCASISAGYSTTECEVLKPQDVGRAVLYAVTQPPYVAVNEILVEPRDEPI
jgi:hypothetical protein